MGLPSWSTRASGVLTGLLCAGALHDISVVIQQQAHVSAQSPELLSPVLHAIHHTAHGETQHWKASVILVSLSEADDEEWSGSDSHQMPSPVAPNSLVTLQTML